MKSYHADVCRTIEVIDTNDFSRTAIVSQEMRLGNHGPLHRAAPFFQFGPASDELTFLLFERDVLKTWDANRQCVADCNGTYTDPLDSFAVSHSGKLFASDAGSAVMVWGKDCIQTAVSWWNLFSCWT